MPMEKADQDLVQRVVHIDPRVKKLYEEHLEFEKQLLEFGGNGSLSTWDEQREKFIKKQKLRGMDRLMALLSHYRQESSQAVNE